MAHMIPGIILLNVVSISGYSQGYASTDVVCIYECVFRHMFDRNGSELRGKSPVHFISIHGKDPRQSLLDRFKTDSIPVQAISKSMLSNAYLSPVIDKASKRECLRFNILRVRRISNSSVVVIGSYFHRARASAEYRFTVVKIGAAWKVIKETITMVS